MNPFKIGDKVMLKSDEELEKIWKDGDRIYGEAFNESYKEVKYSSMNSFEVEDIHRGLLKLKYINVKCDYRRFDFDNIGVELLEESLFLI